MFIIFSILLGLGSMLAYAYSNVQVKPLRQTYSSAQVICLRNVWAVLFLAVCAIPNISAFQNKAWTIGAIALGVAGYVPLYAFMRAIKDTPVGIVSPISGSSPLVAILLSALFLNTTLTRWQWVAAIVIVIANMAITFDFRSIQTFSKHPHADGIAWSLGAAFGWGIFYFLMVPFTEKLGAWNAALFVEIGVLCAALLHMKLTKTLPPLHDLKRTVFIVNGVLIAVGTALFSLGVQHYSVPIVQVLSNSTAFAASFFGYILLKEHLKRRERMSGAVITFAVIALVVFSK